jgi:hypothetical protein
LDFDPRNFLAKDYSMFSENLFEEREKGNTLPY